MSSAHILKLIEISERTLATARKTLSDLRLSSAVTVEARCKMHHFMLYGALVCSPTLLGVHLEAAGITESAQRSERLERLLRSNGIDEEHEVQMRTEESSSFAADTDRSLPQVRGAEEACRGLSNFSCAASAATATARVSELVALHRRSLEEAERTQSEDCAMQVDSPPSNDNDNSSMVDSFLKVSELISMQHHRSLITLPMQCRCISAD